MKLSLSGAVLAFAVLCPSLSHAQSARPATLRITDRIARNHFELGNEYFQIARYDDAAREFQAALDLSHQPELLFNIGRALEGGGHIADALDAYRRFDEAGAPGFDRELLHARMETLRGRVAASPSPAPEPVAMALPSPTPTASPPPAASASPEPSAVVSPPPRYTYHRGAVSAYGPFVVVGLGVVAGGFAAWQAVAWSGDNGTIQNVNQGAMPWGTNAQSAFRNAGTEGVLAWALGGAGVALIGAGAVWLAVRGPGHREVVSTPSAWLVPTSGGVMFGVRGAL